MVVGVFSIVFAPVVKAKRKRLLKPPRVDQPAAVLAPVIQQASSGGGVYSDSYAAAYA